MPGTKRKSGSDRQATHRLPLGAVADAAKRRRSGPAKRYQADEEASVPSSLSARILREARRQQREELLADSTDDGTSPAVPYTSPLVPAAEGEEEDNVDGFDGFDALSEYDGGEVKINEEDEKALAAFVSNDRASERTLGDIILQKIRDKRLHFALYQSLKKSLYKPAAFHKGILLPLCQERNCTLLIIGSIIQKLSIRFRHAGAALVQLAEMEYCGTTSYFIKLFLDKKYALPYSAFDAVLAHFMWFLDDERIMPVIWHQSLLAFVERYKNEFEKKDKEKLARLLDHQKHYLVTPEIRRELWSSCNRRGEKDASLQTSPPISVIARPIEEDRWDVPQVPMEED